MGHIGVLSSQPSTDQSPGIINQHRTQVDTQPNCGKSMSSADKRKKGFSERKTQGGGAAKHNT